MKKHNPCSGQVLPITLVFTTVLLTTLLALIHLEHRVKDKVDLQIAADLTLLSAVRVQARAMNAIAVLNQGIQQATNMSRTILIVWVGLAACAAVCTVFVTCGCKAKLIRFSPRARKMLKRLRKIADNLAKTQDRIIQQVPVWTKQTIRRLAKKNNIPATKWRFSSRLHVQRGQATGLGGIEKCQKQAKMDMLVCRSSRGLLGWNLNMPGLIYLKKTFHKEQKLGLIALNRPAKQKVVAQGKLICPKGKADPPLKPHWQATLTPISFKP